MKTQPVSKLNLAPKRRKPLSLWNPLDYIQLLYWVFFFPQASEWYVQTLCEDTNFNELKTWHDRKQWWTNCPVQRNFLAQGLLLAIFVPLASTIYLRHTGVCVSSLGLIFGISLGIAGSIKEIVRNVPFMVAFSILGGCTGSIAFISLKDIESSGLFFISLSIGITLGVSYAVALIVQGEANQSNKSLCTEDFNKIVSIGYSSMLLTGTIVLAGGITLWSIPLFSQSSEMGNVSLISLSALVLLIAWTLSYWITLIPALLRPEVWIYSTLLRVLPHYRRKVFGHTTFIPLVGLSQNISDWLRRDWLTALYNINELLIYTQQSHTIIKTIIRELEDLPPNILLLRISQLSENLINYGFLKRIAFYAVSPPEGAKIWKLRSSAFASAAAGFFYLHEDNPEKAKDAFSSVEHLTYGMEMKQLSNCLSVASEVKSVKITALADALVFPERSMFRPHSWAAIRRLRSVVDDTQIIYRSYSRSARSLALNRALGELTTLVKNADRIPKAERASIVRIAKIWQEQLLSLAADIGKSTVTSPVHNPYVAGDPVEGKLFVGRSKVIEQLEELWLIGNQLQSVVLYGHRRMGKTSILKNLSSYLGNNTQVVYINLLNLGAVSQGAGEVLITLTDAISTQLSVTPPDDETLLRLPYPTFRRFVQTINQTLRANQGLIIALDEFEKIEELILAGKLDANFLGFLRGLLQMSPKIAFAFAGLHTLEEMTADYFNPLFASVLPIRIGFFTLPETRELLANPAEDFTLDYHPETLNEIYRLTAGQPYLTQLIGFQLVRHYNHQVFDQGTEREPIFTPEDLDTVIHQSDFFTKGRYYFTGVWNQAAQAAPGQQEILQRLAEKEEGRTTSSLRRKLNMPEAEASEALKTLERHDVIEKDGDNWKIIVPLFRKWVTDYQ